VRVISAATSAALRPLTSKDSHDINSTSTAEDGDDRRLDEPRCDFCGRPCGRFTRFGFLPPQRRRRRRLYLPRDRPD
jgi:hypothetical protein